MSLAGLARQLTRFQGLYSWPINALTRPVTGHARLSVASVADSPSGTHRQRRGDVCSYSGLPALSGCRGALSGRRGALSGCRGALSGCRGEGFRYTSTNAELLETVNTEAMSQQQSQVFGVVHISGRQFKITANDLIAVNQIEADIGSEIYLKKVLLAGTENFTLVGQPILSNEVVTVKATVVEHNSAAKVIVFKKKRRKNYKRTQGHRQPISVLRINTIELRPALK